MGSSPYDGRCSASPLVRDLAASEARARELADEQAALRRVATMVAQEVSPEDVFRNVAEEIGLLLGAEFAAIFSYLGRSPSTIKAYLYDRTAK